jgi:parvulin-like peptidyl-prolyl isomerase
MNDILSSALLAAMASLVLVVGPGAPAQDAKQQTVPGASGPGAAGKQEKTEKPEKAGAPGKSEKPSAQAEAPEGAKEGGLPPGVVARVNGKEITAQDYTAYLFATLGKSKLREFIDRLLMEEEGNRLKITVTPEEVEDRVNAQVETTLRGLYQNNMERFTERLSQKGLTLEEHKGQLRQETAYRLLEEKIILSNRKITEEDIQARFEQTYGPGGVQYELRHILVSTRPRAQSPGEARPQITDQEARAKAEKVLKEIQAGADFVQLVKAYSDDDLTRQNDGRIPQYRRRYYGQEFDEAVSRLTEENRLSGVVHSTRGYHLIQLLSRKTTKLEEHKEEIVNFLKNQPPTFKEKRDFIQSLREKAKIEM